MTERKWKPGPAVIRAGIEAHIHEIRGRYIYGRIGESGQRWRLDGTAIGAVDDAEIGRGWSLLPPAPDTCDVWVNVYRFSSRLGCRESYLTRMSAEENRNHNEKWVGCHRITLRAEFEEE